MQPRGRHRHPIGRPVALVEEVPTGSHALVEPPELPGKPEAPHWLINVCAGFVAAGVFALIGLAIWYLILRPVVT